MSGPECLEALARLSKRNGLLARLSLETPYGLVVDALDARADGSIDIGLTGTAATPSLPSSNSDISDAVSNPTKGAGYRYYIWPDYNTSFVWYEQGWWRNPEGRDNVQRNELLERYSEQWCTALEGWVDRYTQAFELHECYLGGGGEPFPDPEERAEWALEGMLLACWLVLQPDVDAVDFEVESTPGQYPDVLEKGGLGLTLARLLRDLQEDGN